MRVAELIDLLQKTDPHAGVVIHDHGTDWALEHLEVREQNNGRVILSADPELQRHFDGLRGTPYEVIK